MSIKLGYILYLFFHSLSCDMSYVREQFHEENNSEEKLEERISNMQSMDCEEVTPYLACAIMQRAEHSNWPPNQLSHFNEGKKILEDYIAIHPNDVEARFVRYLIQKGSPGFLGYSDHIEQDLEILNEQLSSLPLDSSVLDKMNKAIYKVSQ